MDVEEPDLASVSDGDDAVYERLCREQYDEDDRAGMGNETLSMEESGSSSSSSSSSVEAEEEESYNARVFTKRRCFNPCVSAYEINNLVTAPRPTKYHKAVGEVKKTRPMVVTKEEDRVTLDDRKRTSFSVEVTGVVMEVVIENYVFSSYLCNAKGEPYRLSLKKIAALLLAYGIQFSKNKFTKITIKYVDGPSHYLFKSGVIVESGTYGNAISYKCHHLTMRILSECCLNEHIYVKKRRCQNIVAKGTLPFAIRIELLAARYPDCVKYEKARFAGAIIRLNDIDADEEEDDYSCVSSWGNSESDSDSSSSYEYFERMPYEEKTCHEDFDYEVQIDKKTRKANEDLLRKREEGRPVEKKPMRHRDLLHLHNPDDLNDYQIEALSQKKNETILVFMGGRTICAGCRKDAAVKKAFDKVIPMLESCQDNEVNRQAEQDAIAKLAVAVVY